MNIKIVQRKDRVYSDGRSPLFIRFTQNRQSKYVSTGISLLSQYWDENSQRIDSSHIESEALNYKLKQTVREYQKKINKLTILDIPVNFETLLGEHSKYVNCTITEFFIQEIKQLKVNGKVGTASKYETCLSLLQQCNLGKMRFEQVNLQYLQKFETFLVNKGNKPNSIATDLSVLRAAYNKAIKQKVFNPTTATPFQEFNLGKYWKPTRKRAILKEDILKLKALELPDNDFYLSFSRDIFMFSYYVAGINFKDIATLRFCDIQNGRIYYQRHKTGKEMNCQVIPESQQIIDRYASSSAGERDYIFPILDCNVHKTEQQIYNRVHKVLGHINKNLETLSKMAGIKTHLTTYVARHTYATVLKRSGVNIALISESLGHSDLSTTQIYLDSFENTQIDQAMQNLL